LRFFSSLGCAKDLRFGLVEREEGEKKAEKRKKETPKIRSGKEFDEPFTFLATLELSHTKGYAMENFSSRNRLAGCHSAAVDAPKLHRRCCLC
jgi:hypothetical protein